MSKKEVVVTIRDYENLLDKYATQMSKIKKAMDKLKESYEKLIQGDGTPYWNGRLAKKYYKTASSHLKNDVEKYNEAADVYNELAKKYNKLIGEQKI